MNRIRERREAMGISLRELSRKTGLSVSTLNHVELERNGGTIYTGTLIAKALDTTLDGLFWYDEEGGTQCQK